METIRGTQSTVLALRQIMTKAKSGEGQLTTSDLLDIASMYHEALNQLEHVFTELPAQEQRDGRELARKLRAEESELFK